MAYSSIPLLYDKLRPLIAPWSTQVLALEGLSKYGGETLRAIYVGSQINLNFLASLFLRNVDSTLLAHLKHPILAIRNKVVVRSAETAHLLLTDTPYIYSSLLGTRYDFQLPAWIRQEVVLDQPQTGDAEILPRLLAREVGRHQRREQYVIDVTTDEAALLLFFKNLYRPYVESRFGSQALIATEDTFMKHTKGQSLARAHIQGKWVAGMLLSQSKTQLSFGWFGAASVPPPTGVSEVLDAFCIRYAHEQGLTRVIMGNSRPNLNDGVVRYKAKFGARIVPTLFPQARLGIKILNLSDDVTQCLARQSLITQSAGRCYVYKTKSNVAARPYISLDPL